MSDDNYFPGKGCKCAARSEYECACGGVDWRSEREVELEAIVAAMEWTEVESGGMPDEADWYLCAFSDGTVESFHIDEDDIAEGGWSSMSIRLTHWTANPAHPTRA